MSWAHPLVLALVPMSLVAAWWTLRRATTSGPSAFANIKQLWADRRGLSDQRRATARRTLRGLLLAAGAAAVLIALARPQWGEIATPHVEQSREVVLALDLSRSMLADDVAPDRLSRAKLLISSLLDELKGERVGLIVFAGTAFVQSPLSADYEVLRDFLAELEPSYLPQGGTDYEPMLRTAVQAFGQPGAADRYLVVLSDGEALDEHWKQLIPSLRDAGIRIIGLGVGTPAGALVPDGDGGLVKDEQGAAVLSRLEPRTLQELAVETGGTYRDAATWVDVNELVSATVAHGRQGQFIEQRNVRLQDRYQWFLAPALLLLLVSYWIEFPLSPLARALPTRGRRTHPASAPAIAAALMALAAWHDPRLASAAVSDPSHPSVSGTASQPIPLAATVAELIAKPTLAAADYARMATDTIQFAQQHGASLGAARTGVIDDALAAVDRGEAADRRAADWQTLRAQLEQLKQPPQPPDQQDPGSAGGSPAAQDRDSGDQPQNGGEQADAEQPGASDTANASDTQSESQSGSPQSEKSENPSGSPQDSASGSGADQPGDSNTKTSSDAESATDDSSAGAGAREPMKEHERGANAGEVQRQEEANPLDAPEAGFGAPPAHRLTGSPAHQSTDAEEAGQQDDERTAPQVATTEPNRNQEAAPPETRMVGGGTAVPGEPQGETALAQALGTMERVRDGDSPAVLFDRMNRAEGQPRARNNEKNW